MRAAKMFSTGSFVIKSSSMQTTVSHKLMFSWPASISVPAQTAAARLCGTTTRPCSAVLTQALPHSYRRGCRASTKFGGGGGDRRGWEEGSASSQQRPHTHGHRACPPGTPQAKKEQRLVTVVGRGRCNPESEKKNNWKSVLCDTHNPEYTPLWPLLSTLSNLRQS